MKIEADAKITPQCDINYIVWLFHCSDHCQIVLTHICHLLRKRKISHGVGLKKHMDDLKLAKSAAGHSHDRNNPSQSSTFVCTIAKPDENFGITKSMKTDLKFDTQRELSAINIIHHWVSLKSLRCYFSALWTETWLSESLTHDNASPLISNQWLQL